MYSPADLLSLFEQQLEKERIVKTPQNLYDPVNYILSLGGKRIRPVMLLMACDLLGGSIDKAFPAALGIEMFHNFSLVHDDIMDRAPLRRGKETVHKKWNANAAILSGDTMLVLAYEYFLKLESENIKPVLDTFTVTAKEVCEGQQYDMNFETDSSVGINDYLEMIRLKTAVLIGAAYKMGGIIAGAGQDDIEHLYTFGLNTGIAFQLMDDLLDAYGDKTSFGKRIHGDIHTNKKTFLYLKALELASEDNVKKLKWYYSDNEYDPQDKVNEVMRIFNDLEIKNHTEKMIDFYHDKALSSFAEINAPDAAKTICLDFTERLMARKY